MAFEPIEQELRQEGYSLICGVDEAGRGPLAGPVCAAAVILNPDMPIAGLNDSKKLTEKKREALYQQIMDSAVAYNIVMVDEKQIDNINILRAAMLAMTAAVEGLPKAAQIALVDGNTKPSLSIETRCYVKGDARIESVAAASILAKVSRDHFMMELHNRYPQYAFDKHKGYGTALHYQKLDEYGISPVHRMTFLKKYFESRSVGVK